MILSQCFSTVFGEILSNTADSFRHRPEDARITRQALVCRDLSALQDRHHDEAVVASTLFGLRQRGQFTFQPPSVARIEPRALYPASP